MRKVTHLSCLQEHIKRLEYFAAPFLFVAGLALFLWAWISVSFSLSVFLVFWEFEQKALFSFNRWEIWAPSYRPRNIW